MKTLVIHPKDVTTDFLSIIYADKDWTVINSQTSRSTIKKAIKAHDRIIMLGHGTEEGLIGFDKRGFVVNSSMIYVLREKECVCIWCNADHFVKRYRLIGFYTGMIISEYEEALMFSVKADSKEIDDSNTLFAESVKNAIDFIPEEMYFSIKKEYQLPNNEVVNFNLNNIFYS